VRPFRRNASAQDPAEPDRPAFEPLEAALSEPVRGPAALDPDTASRVEAESATLSEYRRLGDDTALLTIEVPCADAAAIAQARLQAPGFDVEHPEPIAVTLQPGVAIARLVFAVDRSLPERAREVLEVAAGSRLRFAVPAPVLMPTVGAPDTDMGHAVVSSLQGEELLGYVTVMEKRCAVAERVAADHRAEASVPRQMAQAYREISDVRALLDEREAVYRASADRVQAAEAAALDAEGRAAAAASERDDEAVRAADADDLRAQLAATAAESDELALERDEAQAAAERLVADLEATRAAVEEWSAEAERARTRLADAVARAEELETERDEAMALALEYEAELDAAVERADALDAAAAERGDALDRERDEAVARADALQRERDEAHAGLDAVVEQIEAGRRAAEDAESRLASERTLYEARIVSGVEAERKLHLEVEELKARLGDKRKARSGALRPQPGAATESLVNAQHERLRQTTLEEQRAEVAALERQLERLKHGSGDPAAGR
jgi:DNA repair exonuclease SbcCD ATPase subunit